MRKIELKYKAKKHIDKIFFLGLAITMVLFMVGLTLFSSTILLSSLGIGALNAGVTWGIYRW